MSLRPPIKLRSTTLPRSRRSSFTMLSLAALAAGLILGLIGHAAGDARFVAFADAIRPIGDIWVAALQVTVLPLVISLTLAAIVGARGEGVVGSLAGRAVILFVVLLTAAGLLTIAVASPILRFFPVEPETMASLQAGVHVPETARRAATASADSLGEWFLRLVPRNLFEAAARGDILPLLLFTVLFGLAVTRLPNEHRESLSRTFQGLAAAMLRVARWILVLTPAGVFVFTFRLGLTGGGEAVGILGLFVLIVSGMLLLGTLLLYPVSALFGRTTIRTFARAVAPAQLVAITTRSSIASLPALIEGGRERLRLPKAATGFVLPLCVSVFKLNMPISSPAKLLVLAHAYGVTLNAGTLAAFLVTVILLSFSTVGLPAGATSFRTLPAYLAAGIPIEGVVIMEAVAAIPDIFKTLVNVTGNMSVATILTRSSRLASSQAVAAEQAAAASEAV